MTEIPLRSGTIGFRTGFKSASRIAAGVDRDAIEGLGPLGVRASRCDAILAVRARHAAFEGDLATGLYLRIGLANARGGP